MGQQDRGEPRAKKKKRRLPSAQQQQQQQGDAAAGAVQKTRPPAQAAPVSCPADVTEALARAVRTGHRTLCVLLSDEPDAGACVWGLAPGPWKAKDTLRHREHARASRRVERCTAPAID